MSLDEMKALIDKYLDPLKMVYGIVGDKATQFDRSKKMKAFGELVKVDKSGNRINGE